MPREQHSNFDYDAVDEESTSSDGVPALHDSYTLLRTLLEFACTPQNRNGIGLFHPDKIGNKVLVLLYDIDPTLLGVESKEELLKLMSPSITRRNCELISAQFRAHIRANRALFAIGDAKAARAKGKGSATQARAIGASAQALRAAGRGNAKTSSPTPHKESPTTSATLVVPPGARRSRAVKSEGRSHATQRDGGRTLCFFTLLGMAA